MCLPAWTILCATPLMEGVSSVGPSPIFELLACPNVSLGLKAMHFVFLNASQPLHLALNQSNSHLFSAGGEMLVLNALVSPTALSGAGDSVVLRV